MVDIGYAWANSQVLRCRCPALVRCRAQAAWSFTLLFVDHVRYLTLEDGERSRGFMLHRRDGEFRLDTGEGMRRVVEFVRSLGFSTEWAGERHGRRDPFLEVEGPYSLPDLHDFQQAIADKVRDMLRGDHGIGAERRGMISMPTGFGKTRVAVQAIVEAMRDDGFRGGVLWVADREELCEQAVEVRRQVWSGLGTQAVRLRISRMWGGMERLQPTSEFHVIVATIQTLNTRLSSQLGEYEFLASFGLVVFDEAHRSERRSNRTYRRSVRDTCRSGVAHLDLRDVGRARANRGGTAQPEGDPVTRCERGDRDADRCLVLNVQDNIENFDRKLAFSELDWLWA